MRRTAPDRSSALISAAAANPHATLTDLAAYADLPRTTATALLGKYQPVIEAYRRPQLGWLSAMWQSVAAGALGKLHDASHGGPMPHAEVKAWAITAGIATEKFLLLNGMPTSITAELHQHRVSFSDLADKLGKVARALPAAARNEQTASGQS